MSESELGGEESGSSPPPLSTTSILDTKENFRRRTSKSEKIDYYKGRPLEKNKGTLK
jgi:hypothetical protein